MTKMSFIPDPRYAAKDEKRDQTQQQNREGISIADRVPYPEYTK